MEYRQFGKTDLSLSQVGFGAWAIGGKSFGPVNKSDALSSLAKAEALGCNFVDTAPVYGDSENILGEFLQGRRDKWVVASKYSSTRLCMEETLNQQLERLKTDYLDFYQIHWAPGDPSLYETLYQLKASGKVRYVGVSLSSMSDIDYVIDKTDIDGFQVAVSLLDPLPLIKKLEAIENKKLGVIARSCLHNGFLTGKFSANTEFNNKDDQRSEYSRDEIERLVNNSRRFEFLQNEKRSLTKAAVAYPLSFSQITSVVLSTKNETQAEENFQFNESERLTNDELNQIRITQKSLGIAEYSNTQLIRYWLSKFKRKIKV